MIVKGALSILVTRAKDIYYQSLENDESEALIYVLIKTLGVEKKTKSIQYNVNPEWYEELLIQIDGSDDKTIEFQIHVENPSTFIVAKKSFTLSEVIAGTANKIPIQLVKGVDGKPAGTLSVHCEWTGVESPDAIEQNILKLTGPRPNILRTQSYYAAAKTVYGTIAGLPIINKVSPLVENAVEVVLEHTPLNEKKENEKNEMSIVKVIDQHIDNALNGIDNIVDRKKDEALYGVCNIKNAMKNIKPKDKGIIEVTSESLANGVSGTKDMVTNTVTGTIGSVQNVIGGIFGKNQSGKNTSESKNNSENENYSENEIPNTKISENRIILNEVKYPEPINFESKASTLIGSPAFTGQTGLE